jgi:Xaa-Pro aminopeptidase
MNEHEYRRRRAAAAAMLEERRLEALLVSSPASVRYLTGFTGSNGLAVLTADSAVLFTDSRYRLQAVRQTACSVRTVSGSIYEAVSRWLKKKPFRNLGFDPARLSYVDFLALRAAPARLEPAAGLIEELRMVKSPAEIALIRASVELASRAFEHILRLVRPGITELDLAAELDHRMRKLGAERPAFETIVAAGLRSALPPARPTSKRLSRNGLLLIDAGAQRAGYCSDMTRTLFLGRPGVGVRRRYAAVLEAQLAAISAVREGVTAASVDRAARRCSRPMAWRRPSCMPAPRLGLEIHEPPRLGKGQQTG